MVGWLIRRWQPPPFMCVQGVRWVGQRAGPAWSIQHSALGGEPSHVAAASPAPRAGVAATSPVPVQMWQRRADVAAASPGPGADAGRGESIPAQMWRAFRHRCGSAVRVKQRRLPSTCCYLCPMSRTYTRCCRSKPEKKSTGLKTNKRANEQGARSSS